MKPSDRLRHDREFERQDFPGARDGGSVGAQGTALILELRRLQAALDRGIHDERHIHGERQRPLPNGDRLDSRRAKAPSARRGDNARTRRKSAVGRVVDICLGNLWFSNSPRADRADPSARFANAQSATNTAQPIRRDSKEEVNHASRDHRGESAAREAATWIGDLRRPRNDIDRNAEDHPQTRRPGDQDHARDAALIARPKPVRLAIANCTERLRFAYAFLVGRGTHAQDNPDTELAVRVGHAFEGQLRTGLRVLIVSVGVLGGWAFLVPLSGAVVVPGALVVESKVKKVQHPTGGVVAQIQVQDGSRVTAGNLVARLDGTQAGANHQMLSKQLEQVRTRIARLVAERDGADELRVPHELAARAGDDSIGQLLASERSLFNARMTARRSQKELLRSHVSQLGEQINGLDAQIKSKAAQVDLISGELEGVQGLYQKGLVPLTRLTTLQREAARLEGERGQLVSSIAEAKSKISEAEIQILRIDQDFRTELMKDLRESQDKEAELVERTVAARDLLDRTDIRAPTTGIVHQLAVHTIGGVIAPGEVIMEIVPDSDDLEVEARLPPQDIDQVRLGQTTYVRLSAFNQRTTPQLNGLVSYVSADLSHDRQTNAPYYTVRVTLPGKERRRLAGQQLVSGMPAEVFLQTGSRTMMSYLLKPMTDQLQRTFNER